MEHLKNCPERVAEYEAAAARRPRLIRGADRAAPAGATPPAPPPPVAPAGWTIGPVGSPGTGSVVLYWWPGEGWQLGPARFPPGFSPPRPSPTSSPIDALRLPLRGRWTRCSTPPPTATAGCCFTRTGPSWLCPAGKHTTVRVHFPRPVKAWGEVLAEVRQSCQLLDFLTSVCAVVRSRWGQLSR